MEEVIKLVAEKAGISMEQAKSAVETVVGFVKGKLPPGIADKLEDVISGKEIPGGLAGMAAGIKDKLGL